jgi:hypothetical protein
MIFCVSTVISAAQVNAAALSMWSPSTRDLELIVSHAATSPAHVTARALGVEIEELQDLARRLALWREQWYRKNRAPVICLRFRRGSL